MKVWLERNEVVLKAVASATVALAAAMWAILGLLYPDFIKPLLLPPYLQTTIALREVGKTDLYTVHELSFKLTNTGLNRVYVPASYFVVRAYRIADSHKGKPHAKLSAAEQSALQKTLSKYSPEALSELKAQANNYVMKKEWQKLLASQSFNYVTDLRSPFVLILNRHCTCRWGD